jgi:hypothetical protein
MMQAPADAKRITCAVCQGYLGTLVGTYSEYVPCKCGFQTTVKAVGRRARQEIETLGTGRIEVK